MSVKKGERGESKLEVLHLAHQIENELISYVIRDFGIELFTEKKLPERYNCVIVMTKDALLKDARTLIHATSAANSCKICNEVDFKWRRDKQNKAIASCADMERQCMTIIEVFEKSGIKININKYYRLTQLIIKEIDLLRSWKNKDFSIYKKLKKSVG